jgi:small subunit ribosomal protein S20
MKRKNEIFCQFRLDMIRKFIYKNAPVLNTDNPRRIFLATHQSAIKRNKQNEKRRLRNISIKSNVKTEIKSVVRALETRDIEQSKAALTKAIPVITKAAAKGVFHKKTASRKISRLTKKMNTLKA